MKNYVVPAVKFFLLSVLAGLILAFSVVFGVVASAYATEEPIEPAEVVNEEPITSVQISELTTSISELVETLTPEEPTEPQLEELPEQAELSPLDVTKLLLAAITASGVVALVVRSFA